MTTLNDAVGRTWGNMELDSNAPPKHNSTVLPLVEEGADFC